MAPHSATRATALVAVGSDDRAGPASGKIALDGIDPLNTPIDSPAGEVAKRVMDLAIGAVAAICFLPIALLVAGVLAFTVGGSVLVREQRVGRDGKVFDVLRFRTIGHGMLRRGGLAQLIYYARLDELPQIVNVLRGDMSVVGPRPETPATVARLGASLPSYGFRHRVKPGLTGWSQAMGQWSERDEVQRLEYDLFYVRNRSFLIDMRVLLRTLVVFLLGHAGR